MFFLILRDILYNLVIMEAFDMGGWGDLEVILVQVCEQVFYLRRFSESRSSRGHSVQPGVRPSVRSPAKL